MGEACKNTECDEYGEAYKNNCWEGDFADICEKKSLIAKTDIVAKSPAAMADSKAYIAKASLLNLCEQWEHIASLHTGEDERVQTLNVCSKQLRRLCDKP